jgi:hypothetical protein
MCKIRITKKKVQVLRLWIEYVFWMCNKLPWCPPCEICVSLFIYLLINYLITMPICRSQWPRGLRRRSAAARLLRSWVRISPRAWKFVCCECCVLSGRGLCDELITCPEESYRLWCVVVYDLETSRMRRPWPALGRSATTTKMMPVYRIIYKASNETAIASNKFSVTGVEAVVL